MTHFFLSKLNFNTFVDITLESYWMSCCFGKKVFLLSARFRHLSLPFLECDIEYITPADYEPPPLENGCSNGQKNGSRFEDDPYESIVNSSLKLIEKQKEDKLKEMQMMEKDREEAQAKEAALAAYAQDSKKRLLEDLAKEDAKREEAVKDIQKMKDKEKSDLLSSLHNGKDKKESIRIFPLSSVRKQVFACMWLLRLMNLSLFS